MKLLSDFDGIFVDSELGKAIGWYIAMKRYSNVVDENLFADIEGNDDAAMKWVDDLVKENPVDIGRAKACAGGTTNEFCGRIFNTFLKMQGFADNRKEMTSLRARIKQPILDKYIMPLEENQRFFSEFCKEYCGGQPFGLVTQSRSVDLKKIVDNEEIWHGFPEFRYVLGDYNDGKGFRYAVCAGDSTISKADAYLYICGQLGVKPSETMTFEDTVSGFNEADKADILCAGVGMKKGHIWVKDLSCLDAKFLAKVKKPGEVVTSMNNGYSIGEPYLKLNERWFDESRKTTSYQVGYDHGGIGAVSAGVHMDRCRAIETLVNNLSLHDIKVFNEACGLFGYLRIVDLIAQKDMPSDKKNEKFYAVVDKMKDASKVSIGHTFQAFRLE